MWVSLYLGGSMVLYWSKIAFLYMNTVHTWQCDDVWICYTSSVGIDIVVNSWDKRWNSFFMTLNWVKLRRQPNKNLTHHIFVLFMQIVSSRMSISVCILCFVNTAMIGPISFSSWWRRRSKCPFQTTSCHFPFHIPVHAVLFSLHCEAHRVQKWMFLLNLFMSLSWGTRGWGG